MGQRYADEGKIHHQLRTVPRRRCVAVSCGGESFSPGDAYEFAWDSVMPMKGKYTINFLQYQDFVGCFCMLKDWISSCCVFCADYHNYFQFTLKGMGRSAVCAATQVLVCGETVELPQLHMVVDVPVVWGMRGSSSTR